MILHKKTIVLIVISLFLLTFGLEASEPLVPVRCWQFHAMNVPYVEKSMVKSLEYDINTVIFSHGMIYGVSDLYNGSDRANKLRYLANKAKELDLKVWIWIHELEKDVPSSFIEGKTVNLDSPGFWEWLKAKYDKLYTDFPEFDGILLTFHETTYKIFQTSAVKSTLSMPERFTKMINTINDACRKHGKDLVVRSFLYEPQEMQWFAEGLQHVHPDVMLQSKCVPHDWQPFYPHNQMIGKFPERKLIVEFDCSSEFTGKNAIPYTCPEYFEYRWRYGLKQSGVWGYNARVDHGGYDAIFTPNEINLYTLYRLTEDSQIDAGTIWKEWTTRRYGSAAATLVEKALKPSFDIVNKSLFILEFWITNHSALPEFGYADGHISERTIAKWKPNEPRYAELQKQLMHPDPILFEKILTEKDEAIALSDESLYYLGQAQPLLSSENFNDLYHRLCLLRRVTTIWKLHAEAFFGYKILAEGHHVTGLEERVQRALKGLYHQAKVSQLSGRHHKPPASARQLRKIADELSKKLEQLSNITNKENNQ